MTDTLKNLVKGPVHFTKYRAGYLYYVTDSGFEFPVPVSDTGEATFWAVDKGILFMHYIRKHLETLAKENSPEVSTDAS